MKPIVVEITGRADFKPYRLSWGERIRYAWDAIRGRGTLIYLYARYNPSGENVMVLNDRVIVEGRTANETRIFKEEPQPPFPWREDGWYKAKS
jgi:hypothetical protein